MNDKDIAVELLIGGDTCPINRTEAFALNKDKETIFNDLLPVFKESDLVILNLECPVIEQSTPIVKGGPVLGAKSGVLKVFQESGISGFNLANNHIMDHGDTGLNSTLKECHGNGLLTFGAGQNLKEAEQIRVLNIKGVKIGFLGIAENEYSIASETKAGANPIDIIRLYSQMQNVKSECNHLFVFVHGGNEHYAYPNPMQKKLCRHLVDLGASAVICQHSHIAGCIEDYKDALIVYGQGNFLFDYPSKFSHWEEGFLVKFRILKDSVGYDLIPIYQTGGGAKLMEEGRKEVFLSSLEKRSEEVKDDTIVEEKWLEFCKERRDLYMSILLGHNRYLNYANRKFKIADKIYSKGALRNMSNIVRCESHREVLLTIGKKLL